MHDKLEVSDFRLLHPGECDATRADFTAALAIDTSPRSRPSTCIVAAPGPGATASNRITGLNRRGGSAPSTGRAPYQRSGGFNATGRPLGRDGGQITPQ
jgi:hypothetical protein